MLSHIFGGERLVVESVKRAIERWRLRKPKSYIRAYRQHMDRCAKSDPHAAVGGMWEEIGELQFSFLKSQRLKPWHTLLDLGCGTLRGGRHFLKYLDPGNYTGIDVSPKALDYAMWYIQTENLTDKRPHLILNLHGDMRFSDIDSKFDYVLAQSVFTHLPEPFIVECFDNLHKVLTDTFYFTINSSDRKRLTWKDYQYPTAWFCDLVESRGYAFHDYSREYNHPRDQVMLAASRH